MEANVLLAEIFGEVSNQRGHGAQSDVYGDDTGRHVDHLEQKGLWVQRSLKNHKRGIDVGEGWRGRAGRPERAKSSLGRRVRESFPNGRFHCFRRYPKLSDPWVPDCNALSGPWVPDCNAFERRPVPVKH